MAEYIEREKAIQFLEKHMDNVNSVAPKDSITSEVYDMAKRHAINYLRYVPHTDVVVAKYGKWNIKTDDYDCEYMMCSCCKEEFYPTDADTVDLTPNYCPNCGAEMDGDKNG